MNDRPLRWLALALTLVGVLPVWLVEHPPLQDYPYHLVRANVLAEWHDPELAYPETFTRSAYPTPYVLVDYLIAGLAQAMPIEIAGKLVLSLYLALLPWSLFYLLAGVDRGKWPLGFFGFLFAYNWYFQMGFVNYTLSLPAALFAIGFWWRHLRGERALTGRAALGLAGLATLVYLLHIYSFGVLAAVLAVLALVERVGWWRAGATAAAFVPGAALLAGYLVLAPSAGEGSPLLLLYGGPARKLHLLLGALPAFSVRYESALFAAGLLLAAGLLAAAPWWRRRSPDGAALISDASDAPARETASRAPEWSFLWVVIALAALFVALPDHVGDVFFVSNRVPPYVLFLGLVLLAAPGSVRRARLVAGTIALLALAQITGVAVAYRAVSSDLAAYEAALARLPTDARIAFRAERATMQRGRIAPAALFGGYHYLSSPGDRLPDLEHFVGAGRAVAYRAQAGESLSTAAVDDPERLAELVGSEWLIGRHGALVVVGASAEVTAAAARYGYRSALAAGPVEIFRKAEPVFYEELEEPEESSDRYYATGYAAGFDYLVVYQDPAHGPVELEPPVAATFEPVWTEGPVTVYRRRLAAAA